MKYVSSSRSIGLLALAAQHVELVPDGPARMAEAGVQSPAGC
jgi:hypothetical protein